MGLSSIRGLAEEARNVQKQLATLKQRAAALEEIRRRTEPATKAFAQLTYQINETNNAISRVQRSARNVGLDLLERSLGGVTKKLISFNTTLVGLSFDFVIDSIKRVYDLQEKWARSIGGLNMRLGGLSAGIRSVTRVATRWSSVMRGLTNDDIQTGIQMAEEFTLTLGRMSKAVDFERWGLQVARGFNLGGQGAAELGQALDSIGVTVGEASKLMGGDLVSAAQQADVPVNLLAKDILDSSTYLARFGKNSSQAFIQGAAYARRFYISMQQLRGAVESFDMFDDAARTASKLNTAFGTMINSMDLMMEDDPAKRMEMIRQQFLAQGKTFDTLQPKQVRYLSETLNLSEKQVAALLDVRNAHMSYSDFRAKEMAKEKAEVDAKRNMELMLRKTTQTLFAFGAAFDRITLAIAKAIAPMLRVFGLVKGSGKDWKSFGAVMSEITSTVEEFFNSLAEGQPNSQKWQDWMQTIATDIVRAGRALKDFVMSGRAARLVGDLSETVKNFYTWIRDLGLKAVPYLNTLAQAFLFLANNVKVLAAAWLGIKGLNSLVRPGGAMGAVAGLAGGGNKGLGAGRIAKAGIGVAGGVAAGAVLGGGGASIGGAIGGMIGQFMGPFGAALAPVVGAVLGKLVDHFTRDEEMEDSRKRLADAQSAAANSAQRLSVFQERAAIALRKSDLERSRGDKAILDLQRGKQLFEIKDKEALIARVKQLQGFGKNHEAVAKAFEALTTNGQLTKDMLQALRDASADYNSKLSSLRDQTAEFIKLQQEKMGFEVDEIKTSILKNKQAAVDLEIAELKRQKAQLGDVSIGDTLSVSGLDQIRKHMEIDNKIRQAELEKNDIGISIAEQQRRTTDKMLAIEMKRLQMELLVQDAGFIKFVEEAKQKGLDKIGPDKLAQQYLLQNVRVQEDLRRAMGISREEFAKVAFSQGGIVTRPTQALIGESGPEAVIPLRSIARGRMPVPVAHGGQAAAGMINMATQPPSQASGGAQVVSTVADVRLDGQVVGRALVRSIITGR